MLHMQIPTINISLQHYCYKSLGNACPYFTERKIYLQSEYILFCSIIYRYKGLDNVCPYLTLWEENHRFSPGRKILLYSLFLLVVKLKNRLYRYFCVEAMIMMLIYASTCVTLVCNHTNIASI